MLLSIIKLKTNEIVSKSRYEFSEQSNAQKIINKKTTLICEKFPHDNINFESKKFANDHFDYFDKSVLEE